MSALLHPLPLPAPLLADPLAHRLAALTDCRDRYQRQIRAQLAVLELAAAQGDEAEMDTAQVEIACAIAARSCAVQHLERLQPATMEATR